MKFRDRTNRGTMTRYEAEQCDVALKRLAHYLAWRRKYPTAAYTEWASRHAPTVF